MLLWAHRSEACRPPGCATMAVERGNGLQERESGALRQGDDTAAVLGCEEVAAVMARRTPAPQAWHALRCNLSRSDLPVGARSSVVAGLKPDRVR
jgi:hypothetical protein